MTLSPQDNLLKWYLNNKRNLPFRLDKNPYNIWVSEVMLQQTRVNAMLGSYYQFTKELPDLNSLAKADEDKVISLWKGLGYYTRAKNLRKGAIYLELNHSSTFPKNLDELLKVPGIGPYTAKAILSIAFDLPHAVLDGNVKRVLSRFFLFNENIGLPKSHYKLQILADSFLNLNSPGDHNQAIMEIGALICTPIPNCKICPLNSSCKAFSNNLQEKIPISMKEKKRLQLEMRFFLFMNSNNEIHLYIDKNRRFFKSIASPPFLLLGENLNDNYKEKNNELRKYLESIDTKPIYLEKKHSITNHDIVISYIVCKLDEYNNLNITTQTSSIEELEEKFPSSIAKKIRINLLDKKLF
jgi:A/G-specific adenine glycosylase